MLAFPRYRKDPDSRKDYRVDWSAELDDDTISSSEWTVPTGLTSDLDTSDDTNAVVWLEGGTLGTEYEVTNSIVTAAGRELDQTIVIVIEQE